MFETIYSVHKNKIRLQIPEFRKYLEGPDVDIDDAIEYIKKTNYDILKKYPSLIVIVSVNDVCLEDIQYIWAITKLILSLQKLFKNQTESIHITNSSPIFKIVFESVKPVIDNDILRKIKIE